MKTKLQIAILECLAKPRGSCEGMMTTLELLADKRLAPFWFLRARLYYALDELIDEYELVFVAQRDLITPERGFPRNYYALVSREGVKASHVEKM